MYTVINNLWSVPFALLISSSICCVLLNLVFETKDAMEDKKNSVVMKVTTAIAFLSLGAFVVTYYMIDVNRGLVSDVLITAETVDQVKEDAFTGKIAWEKNGEIYLTNGDNCAVIEVSTTRLTVTPTPEAPYHDTHPIGLPDGATLPYHEVVQTNYCHNIKILGREYRSKPFQTTIFHRFYVSENYFTDSTQVS